MPAYSYHTLKGPSQGIYKEKGSKFLAFAYPVSSEMEIKERIETLRKEYFDARHHCFAWMLGLDKDKFRSFDDGEPNHSAGDPILGQIRSKGITDVLVVVVRYFGGVKLGVGGLISAYKAAAEEVLNNAEIVEKEVTEILDISFDYEITSDIMRMVKDFDLKIIEQSFGDAGRIKGYIALRQKEKLLIKIDFMRAMGKNMVWKIES